MNSWTTSDGQVIHQILGGRCNGFLIAGRKGYLLVDPGSKIQWNSLRRRLAALGIYAETLRALILTHCHFDHAANAANIKSQFQTCLIGHTSEADYLRRGDNPFPGGTTFITRLLAKVLLSKPLERFTRYQPVEPDVLVAERYDLQDLGFNGYLLHTPGHSPGSLSVILEDEIALVGDTLFGVFPEAVFPPYAENPRQMLASWEKLLDTGCALYLPGHGGARSRAVLRQQWEKHQSRRE
ncbi:MAG TPA: MBL fold metallo-hydrolase [Anaerolineae bacterium]|nr:MBL fold metallo-hydrolase [Anaerolineae bacterium]